MDSLEHIARRVLSVRGGLKQAIARLRHGSDFDPGFAIPERPSGARSGVGIAIIAKDEASYLPEWLEFHLMLGVRRIYLYDNGSTDGTPERLGPWIASGAMRLVPWRNFCGFASAQTLAYAHALANFGPDHRWMAFIDVDEFLFPQSGASLAEALEELAHLPAVSIPWRNFGPDGREERPDGLVIESYTECAPVPPRPSQRALLRYKSVVDPAQVAAGGSHLFPLRGAGKVAFNQRGDRLPHYSVRNMEFAVEGPLQLNHYFTRSHAEMRSRVAKGRVSANGRVSSDYIARRLDRYAICTERNDAILRFAPELRRRLAAMGECGAS